MNWDDTEPRTAKPTLRDLEPLSIEALGDYITELQNEIDRVQREIDKKHAARNGAEAFFKR